MSSDREQGAVKPGGKNGKNPPAPAGEGFGLNWGGNSKIRLNLLKPWEGSRRRMPHCSLPPNSQGAVSLFSCDMWPGAVSNFFPPS